VCSSDLETLQLVFKDGIRDIDGTQSFLFSLAARDFIRANKKALTKLLL